MEGVDVTYVGIPKKVKVDANGPIELINGGSDLVLMKFHWWENRTWNLHHEDVRRLRYALSLMIGEEEE
jgi:hypothetical protein